MKTNKGVTLLILVITIIVMGIIAGAVITLATDNLKIKGISNLYSDIKVLNDNVKLYYAKHNTLPIKERYLGNTDFFIDANPNDETTEYYILDISKIPNVTLLRKLTWENDDVYIINKKTQTIYYPKGVQIDSERIFRLPDNNTQIEFEENINDIVSVSSLIEYIYFEESNAIENYFTIKESSLVQSIRFVDQSNNNIEVSNTNSFALGTHIIKCIVTLNDLKEVSAIKSINVIERNQPIRDKEEVITFTIDNIQSHIGEYVDLGNNPLGFANNDTTHNWRILDVDNNGCLLLILAGYLPNTNSCVTAANLTTEYTYGIYSNIGASDLESKLLNTSNWKDLANGISSAIVIGNPTGE